MKIEHPLTGRATDRLSGDQVLALRFAAHRQLARWSKRPQLSPHQRAQRSALKGAVRVLHDHAFTGGCALHVPEEKENIDV